MLQKGTWLPLTGRTVHVALKSMDSLTLSNNFVVEKL